MGGMVSRPGSGHLPVRASARAFVRPRFASIRASADARPALPILNVSCAHIRAALSPCGSAPALDFPFHIWKVSRPTSGHLPVRASARAFVRPRFASIRASADARPALPILNVSCAHIRAALSPCGSAPALDFPFHIWKVSRPTSGHLPVRASARAFVRPRFASVRASADIRPALPMLNVSYARIRAASPPCGNAPA